MSPKFSKRHYEEMAKVISQISNPFTSSTITYFLVDVFKADNPNFNPDKFLAACHKEPAK